MSFKHKFISAITLALAIGTFSTFVAAQDSTTNNQTNSTKKEGKFERRAGMMRGDKGMRGGKHGGDRMLMGALYRLNLTDAQKEQIKSIHESNRPNQEQREEMRGLAQKKRDGSITEQELARLKEIKTQSKANAQKTHTAVLAVLTAEQRTQLEQMKQEKGERRGGRKGILKREAQTPSKSTDN